MEQETMSVEQAAVRLGIGRRLAYEAAKRGELPVIRIGSRIRVSKVGLDEMLKGEKTPASA